MTKRAAPPGSGDDRKRRAAERPGLNRERVLRAALDLADARGLDALSMRTLAQSLGVEAMSLYNHVQNKDDLLLGMLDLVVAEIALPVVGGAWQEEMRRRAMSAHAQLMKHPWATMLIVSRVNVGPYMLRYVDSTVGCLMEAGFSVARADHIWNTLDSYIYGFTLYRLNFPYRPEEYVAAATTFLPMIPQDKYPYMYHMSVGLIAGEHNGVTNFEFGLDALLDGLARLAEREKMHSHA